MPSGLKTRGTRARVPQTPGLIPQLEAQSHFISRLTVSTAALYGNVGFTLRSAPPCEERAGGQLDSDSRRCGFQACQLQVSHKYEAGERGLSLERTSFLEEIYLSSRSSWARPSDLRTFVSSAPSLTRNGTRDMAGMARTCPQHPPNSRPNKRSAAACLPGLESREAWCS